MNEQQLRKHAAELARDCRAIDRSGNWTIKAWNDSVRMTIRHYMNSTRRFCQVHDMWEQTGKRRNPLTARNRVQTR